MGPSENGLAESQVLDFNDLVGFFYLPKRDENSHIILDDPESQDVLRGLCAD